MPNIIELKHLTKTFGDVVANDNVTLSIKQGEILALLGENGSGKTTLMNILSGIYRPDKGTVYVEGQKVQINSPEDAKRYGIGMVHQHFKLVDDFSAADNIWMGTQTKPYYLKEKLRAIYETPRSYGENKRLFYFKQFLRRLGEIIRCGYYHFSSCFLTKKRYYVVREIADKFGFEIDPKKNVHDMSVSEKQTIEIIKVLYYGARVIVLDEPTAVLTVQEIRKLFDILRKMKERGHSIIIITHKLNEVLEISDRVAIMRKGKYIDTVKTSETSVQELTDLMVGHKVDLNIERPSIVHDKPLLEIRNLVVKNDENAVAIRDLNFYIRGGEILGVAGISGCGQKELCEAIAGLRKVVSGEINHMGQTIIGLSPKSIIEKGIAMSFIPEDRLGMGLAPSLSVTDNMMLKTYKTGKTPLPEFQDKNKALKKLLSKLNPFVDRKSARERAKRIIAELGIITPSTETPVRRLSGGNVQKVLVGREIDSGPNVIITAYPVRGLDINSSYAIYNILNREKRKGTGVLYVGEDLDVMLALCDKIMVICHGKLMGVVHADKTTKEELGLMMTGSLDLNEVKTDKQYGVASDSNIKAMSGDEGQESGVI